MSATVSTNIDLIRELRLRQWARGHYVRLESRSRSWHPIVLDEMRRRDEELLEAGVLDPAAQLAFVPLAPSTLHEFAAAS